MEKRKENYPKFKMVSEKEGVKKQTDIWGEVKKKLKKKKRKVVN